MYAYYLVFLRLMFLLKHFLSLSISSRFAEKIVWRHPISVCGYLVYKDRWAAAVGELLTCSTYQWLPKTGATDRSNKLSMIQGFHIYSLLFPAMLQRITRSCTCWRVPSKLSVNLTKTSTIATTVSVKFSGTCVCSYTAKGHR